MAFFIPDFLRPLLAAPVAVFGSGQHGQAVMALLAQLGVVATLFDEKDVKNGIVNNFGWSAARKHRLVIFSPGFAPDDTWLATARAAGAECLGEIDFASLFWRGRLVAITGTNGKTTLAEFLAHALRSVGVEAQVTGNSGFPLTQLVIDAEGGSPDDVAVCEVSSFQAETLRYLRPEATLWTNFAEDHLDRHPGMESYFAAKWRLVERTPPAAVFAGESVQRYATKFSYVLPANSVVFSEVKTVNPALTETVFASQPQYENYLLAAAWWKRSGRSDLELKAAAQTFVLGRHRLAEIGSIDDVTWWNDSNANNFHAVEAALATFADPVFVILGGRNQGGDAAAFVRRIAPRIKQAFLLGETRQMLATFCRTAGVPHVVCETLAETVSLSAETARPGDHILLSPGFASPDLFRGYDDRGEQLESFVNNLGAMATLR